MKIKEWVLVMLHHLRHAQLGVLVIERGRAVFPQRHMHVAGRPHLIRRPLGQEGGREPLLIGVLKGAFMFTADLMRALNIPVDVDFVRVSTYGSGTTSSGRPRILQGVRSPIKGRHILIVEDIVDTGLTTRHLEGYLQRKGAASIKLCALLSKPSRRRVEATIDYLGFEIPDRFVVGYGLDYDQRYRYLPDVCVLDEGGA